MRLSSTLPLVLALAACAPPAAEVDEVTPAVRPPTAADSARASRIAAMVGQPVARFNGMIWEGPAPAPPSRGSGGVLVAFIAHDGRVDPQTLTVLQTRGPLTYTRNVCQALPGLRLRTIQGQPIESLVIMPLTHESNRIHAELLEASGRIQTMLREMSVDERRSWLLDWGCSRYQ